MKLQQFIQMKQTELETQYRSVQLRSYVSVTLSHRSVAEKFTAGNTHLEQIGHEVTRDQFPKTEFTTLPEENGTQVVFDVIRKGRRKPERAEFYFLWDAAEAEDDKSQKCYWCGAVINQHHEPITRKHPYRVIHFCSKVCKEAEAKCPF